MSESSGSNTSFADRLKAARERREMTQADLARKTGMQPSATRSRLRVIDGSRLLYNIRALSQALDVTSDYLMGAGEQATAFRNEGKLSDKDREYIQDIINVMVKKKERGVGHGRVPLEDGNTAWRKGCTGSRFYKFSHQPCRDSESEGNYC